MTDLSVTARAEREAPEPNTLHRRLARWNRTRLAIAKPDADWRHREQQDSRMRLIEGAYIETAREESAAQAAAAPTDVEGFITWFEDLKISGPGQNDPLFPWLAEEAEMEQMRWFLTQEVAGEAGFDDLVALTQVKLPTQAKLELARNYWDEMGRGNPKGMHGPMLGDLATSLDLRPTIERTIWQCHALANTLVAFATTRRYAYHSIGALGVIELTAPTRAVLVAKGLRRLGVSGRARHYFDLHAVLDVKHSQAWNEEALAPLVAADPRAAQYIAEGALMRLTCGARCFDAYRSHFGFARA